MRRNGFSGPSKGAPASTPRSSHQHEFEPVQEDPFLEDGAAIFTEQCNWVEITGSVTSEKHDETFYNTGAECDETRMWRMEWVSIIKKRDDAPNIEFIPHGFHHADPIYTRAEVDIMTNGEFTNIYEDKEFGEVVVETDDWKITYEP